MLASGPPLRSKRRSRQGRQTEVLRSGDTPEFPRVYSSYSSHHRAESASDNVAQRDMGELGELNDQVEDYLMLLLLLIIFFLLSS